ncbi:hypothetical protein ACGF12_22895 [Kitasatospora sp. NPDC048296]|uniref:hypothetical protein n=1 Tax=Kitasatospora sp. NPDC048296 TaxID=3364048 RepID=UPI00370FDBC1
MRVPSAYQQVLDRHPVPPLAASLVGPPQERGLWEIAYQYRDMYVVPATLTETNQGLLLRARAAARVLEHAPDSVRYELHRDKALGGSTFELNMLIYQLARTLSTIGDSPVFDVQAGCWPFLSTLEQRAAQSFDLAIRAAETIAVIVVSKLFVHQVEVPAQLPLPPRESWPQVSERLTCDCGKETWLVLLVDDHAAIGCVCGRLRWEPRITREPIEEQFPGILVTVPAAAFDLDALAAAHGFGPFRHHW